MTSYKMGWLDRVTKINFPNAKGLCFVSYSYGASVVDTPPAVFPATLDGLPYPGEFQVLDDVKAGPNPLVQTGDGTTVTPAMRAGLYQWTAGHAYTKLSQVPVPGSRVWYVTTGFVITKDNFNDPYPGFDQCGNAVTNLGAYGGTIFNCNPQLQGEAAAAGFDVSKITFSNGFDGHFRTQAQAAYNAAAFNATHYSHESGLSLAVGSFVTSQATTLYTREGRANFVLNAGLIKHKLLGGADQFTFTVKARPPVFGTALLECTMSGSSRFPLDAKNKPTFSLPVFASDRGTSILFTGVINVKKNTVTLGVTASGVDPGAI